jgi:hypothetical protein
VAPRVADDVLAATQSLDDADVLRRGVVVVGRFIRLRRRKPQAVK